MLEYKGSLDGAEAWPTTLSEDSCWVSGARARLGDFGIFHHPRVARLGISQDPSAGMLHFLEWAPVDGHPPLPLVLMETHRNFGPFKLPVLTFPNHTLYVYSTAVPGLLPALLDPKVDIGRNRLRFFPRLPLELLKVAGDVPPGGWREVFPEDVAPRILLRERWKGDWNAYWNARDSVIRRARRRERQLQKEGAFEFCKATSLDENALRWLERAMVLHSKRWGDHVNRESDLHQKRNRNRTLDLARHFDLSGAFRQDWILWKGDVAALVMGARFGATWFFYWAAINPEAAHYSPGNVLYKRILEEAFSDGFEVADFMLGGAAYKERWSDSAPEVSTVLQSAPGLSGQALYGMLRLARKLKRTTRS